MVLLRNNFRLVLVITGLVFVKTSPEFGSTTNDIIPQVLQAKKYTRLVELQLR